MKRLSTKRRRLSLPQAADYLEVHPQTLRDWVKKGYIQPMRSPSPSKFGGRYSFTREQLEKFEATLATQPELAAD